MNEKTFKKDPSKLRSPQRIEKLKIPEVIAAVVKDLSIESLLDVGCGTGVWTEAFVKSGLDVTGFDLSESMIIEASKYAPKATFKTGEFDNLPFDDHCFDLVFFGHVIHESDDISVTLKEAKRVGIKRIAIHEWPYREEEFGPPLNHRLHPETVRQAVQTINARSLHQETWGDMILYCIDI